MLRRWYQNPSDTFQNLTTCVYDNSDTYSIQGARTNTGMGDIFHYWFIYTNTNKSVQLGYSAKYLKSKCLKEECIQKPYRFENIQVLNEHTLDLLFSMQTLKLIWAKCQRFLYDNSVFILIDLQTFSQGLGQINMDEFEINLNFSSLEISTELRPRILLYLRSVSFITTFRLMNHLALRNVIVNQSHVAFFPKKDLNLILLFLRREKWTINFGLLKN